MESASTIAEIFADALEREESARIEFLKSQCQNNEKLFSEVKQLLEEYEQAESVEFLSVPAFEVSAEQIAIDENEQTDSRIGQILGHYKIIKRIGAGGMGAIYLAARTDDFEKQVAIKLIKRGMDSEAILKRFRHERQILANLEHPFIARLLDAGTTDDNLPFFVMEFVDGIPVDEYCKRNNLPEAERLELFRKICQAISFAHQKLVVHRDLKPSNILVNQDAEPKLLDFGIAKLLDETDEATQTEARVLTPAYASPEQKRGEIVGTASDIYSLGKILAEILEVENLRFKTQDSKSISTTKSESQKPKIESLNRDLRNILAKSLREETERRYSSVEKFSDDVRRYLSNLPITARLDTFAYRASKFVERNKVSASITFAVFLILIAAVAGIIWQARQAEIERELAERRAENLRKLSNSFAVELHNAILNLPGSLPARQLLLTRAVEQLDSLAAESGNKPEIQDDLAQGYYNLGLLPNENLAQVEQNFQKGTAIYQKLLENEPQNARFQQQLAKGYGELANVQKVRGDLNGSLNYLQKSLALLQTNAESKPEDAQRMRLLYETQNDISADLLSMGKANESLEVSRQAFALGEKLEKLNAGDDDFERMLYTLHYGICKSLIYLGDYAAASEQLQNDLNIILQQASEHSNDTRYQYEIWAYYRTLGLAVEQTGDKNSALQKLESALDIIEYLRHTSPEDAGYQRNSSYTYFSLGQFFVRQNQPEKALPYFRNALELSEKIFNADSEKGETREDLARIYSNLGNDLTMLGKRQEGIDYLKNSLEFYEKTTAYDSQNVVLKSDLAKALAWLGDALMKSDNPENLKESQGFKTQSLAIQQDLQAKNLLSAADANQFKTSREMLAQK